jgi:hypothetical protein
MKKIETKGLELEILSFSNLLLWFQFQNDVLTYAIDEKKTPKKRAN